MRVFNDNVSSFASSGSFVTTIYMEEGYSERTDIYVGEDRGVGDWNHYSCGCGGKFAETNAIWREWLARYTF